MASTRKLQLSDIDGLFQRFVRGAESRLLPAARLAVAYSGGLDSTVLLHMLWRLRAKQSFPLRAFHLHHGLSPNADAWLTHCAAVCASWVIPFTFHRADLANQRGASLEARARAARYRAYADLQVDWVALAHHRDDQAETVLYRLVRGAGVHGAAGMPAVRPLGVDKRIWRPLLAESRADLLAYAVEHGLSWVEDESNQSHDYDRNFLRHQVLPVLQARFPAASGALARAARHFAEAAYLLDGLAEMDAGEVAASLSLVRLRSLEGARQRNLLRWFLARHALRPDERQLNMLLEQVLRARGDAMPFLQLGDLAVRRYRERLWVAHLPPVVQATGLSPDGSLPLGWCGRLSWQSRAMGLADCWRSGLEARPRVGGERIRPRVGGPTRPVKDLLQEAGVPPWLRGYWPMLWHGDMLVAVAGLAVAAQCQDIAGGWWPRWQPDGWPDAP